MLQFRRIYVSLLVLRRLVRIVTVLTGLIDTAIINPVHPALVQYNEANHIIYQCRQTMESGHLDGLNRFLVTLTTLAMCHTFRKFFRRFLGKDRERTECPPEPDPEPAPEPDPAFPITVPAHLPEPYQHYQFERPIGQEFELKVKLSDGYIRQATPEDPLLIVTDIVSSIPGGSAGPSVRSRGRDGFHRRRRPGCRILSRSHRRLRLLRDRVQAVRQAVEVIIG